MIPRVQQGMRLMPFSFARLGGIAVCAIVVLGLDASPMLATALGVLAGAVATYALARAGLDG